jgi:hypothetical protein
MDIGAFVLTIDDGREYLQLTDEEGWMSTVQRGTTIIMSVIMTQLQGAMRRLQRNTNVHFVIAGIA